MSSTYANVSIPATPLGTPAGSWLVQLAQSARRALDAVVSARPSHGLRELAERCEPAQPALARELRAAAARIGEG